MATSVQIPAKEVPVLLETEIVVIGGGSGGVGASLAAARSGAQVVLIEAGNCLGGMATTDLVSVFMNSDVNVRRGIYGELLDELYRRKAIIENTTMGLSYDRETYKWILQQKLLDAGVKILFRASCVDVLVEDGKITSVIIDSLAGTQAIRTKAVIDCTRVATIAAKAGAGVLKPDSIDGQSVVYAHTYRGIDFPELLTLVNEDDDYDTNATTYLVSPKGYGGHKYWPFTFIGGKEHRRAARESGDLTYDRNESLFFGMFETGQKLRFLTWMGSDECLPCFDVEKGDYDLETITQIEIEMRKHIWAFYEYLKGHVRGFAHAAIDITPAHAGLWGTRMEGDYVVPNEDMFTGQTYDDAICVASWILDSPALRRFDCPLRDLPYRSFYSKDIQNLFAGGGSISTGPAATVGVVDQPSCISTGQVAGAAAAIAVRDGVDAREVDLARLRQSLRGQGLVTSVSDLPEEIVKEYADSIADIRERMKGVSFPEPRVF
jgi:hypothetical protein